MLQTPRVGSDVELRAVLLRARATSSGLEVNLKLLETPTTWLNAAPPELGEASRNSPLDLQPVVPIFRTPPGIDTPTLGGVFSLSRVGRSKADPVSTLHVPYALRRLTHRSLSSRVITLAPAMTLVTAKTRIM